MRLGNLIDQQTKAELFAVATVPWHKRSDTERMQAVTTFCHDNSRKIGQYLDKKGRMACTEDIPHGRKLMTEWISNHAVALAQANPRMTKDRCVRNSLYEVLKFYGYARPFLTFASDFDRFVTR